MKEHVGMSKPKKRTNKIGISVVPILGFAYNSDTDIIGN